MISTEIKDYIERSVLCWLATVDADGIPNVSPKEIFAPFDKQHLVIANIASPESIKNILGNPNVCVSFIDIFVQKGFKLHGKACVIQKNDEQFSDLVAPLKAMMTPGMFSIHSLIKINITKAQPILAPSYQYFANTTTEEKLIKAAMVTYAVKPLK